MATLDTIDLGSNGFWENEFEGSAVENTQKHTTDGRLFVFQKRKKKYKSIKFNCTWLDYSVVQSLELLRDGGSVVVFTHNDSRVFNVILESVESIPAGNDFRVSYPADFPFEVMLTMIVV